MLFKIFLSSLILSKLLYSQPISESNQTPANRFIENDHHFDTLGSQNILISAKRLIPENGLIPQNVLCMIQDKKGFLWFGTPHGLLKYDGYTITTYLHDPDNPNSLSDNFVESIIVSSIGELWIGTQNGLNRFEFESNTFTAFYPDSGNRNSHAKNWIHKVYEDKNGIFWVSTQGGFHKFIPQTGEFNHLKIKGFAIAEDKAGILWFGGNDGLFRYDRQKDNVTHYLPENNSSDLDVNTIWSLLVDKENVLWIGTRSGLLHLEKDQFGNTKFIRNTRKNNNLHIYPDNMVHSIFEDKMGIMWFSSQSGIYRYDRNTDKKPRKVNVDLIPNQNGHLIFWTVFEDKSGILWIATNNGVYKVEKENPFIDSYYPDPGNKNSLSNEEVKDIIEDKEGIIWVGTADGLNKFDRKNNEWSHFFTELGNANSLSFNYITSMDIDTSGYIWIGTYNGGLNRFDPRKDEWKHYGKINKADELIYHRIHSVCVSRDNTLWIGTWHGILNRYDARKDIFTQYSPGDTNSIGKSSAIQIICEDSFGTLWLGTIAGILNRFDPIQNKFTYYQHEPGNSKSLSNNSVEVLYEDSNKMLWIGTRNGLNRLDLRKLNEENDKPEFTRFLNGKWISGILEDDKGYIWINSGRNDFEFTSFDPQTETFTDYRYLFERPPQLYYKSKITGDFFAGGNGLQIFHPKNIVKDQYKPEVVLTDFQIFNKSVSIAGDTPKNAIKNTEVFQLEKSITFTKEIFLSHNEGVFAFQFAALHYEDPAKNQYAYKMEGLDKGWNNIGTRRYVSFSNIPAGEYTFRVKASNNEGVWNEMGTSLKLIIFPPWWKTWWAYSMYLIIFLGLITGIRKYELNRQKLKHNLELEHIESEKLKEVDKIKTRFFASISHEFRTPLTLINGPVERLLKQIQNKIQIDDLNRIRDNAARMNKLVEMYLDLSRLESGNLKLEKEEGDVIPLIKSILASFESMAQAAKIELKLISTVASATCCIDREKFELIFINLLSNAVKFTPEDGTIIIAIDALNDDTLEIRVSDSGIGIPKSAIGHVYDMYFQVENEINSRISGTGIGLTMVKELVLLHDGQINVESSVDIGTTFIIEMPLVLYTKSRISTEKVGVEKAIKSELDFDQETIKRKSDTEQILIVEDNHQMAEYIQSHLTDIYETKLAANGKQGFAIAVKENPDLIISDVMMPEMDGYEFCTKIKNDFRTSHIPVILLTAKIEEKDMFKGLSIGADNYLKKPFKAAELIVRINNLIENRKRLHKKIQTEKYTDLKDFDITSKDKQFLENCMQIIEENISDPDFSVEAFAQKIAVSRIQLYRKIKALTGLSANKYIQTIRLKKSALLLTSDFDNISQISYECGFSNPSYFTKAFKEMFGISPSEFIKKSKM